MLHIVLYPGSNVPSRTYFQSWLIHTSVFRIGTCFETNLTWKVSQYIVFSFILLYLYFIFIFLPACCWDEVAVLLFVLGWGFLGFFWIKKGMNGEKEEKRGGNERKKAEREGEGNYDLCNQSYGMLDRPRRSNVVSLQEDENNLERVKERKRERERERWRESRHVTPFRADGHLPHQQFAKKKERRKSDMRTVLCCRR